MSKREFLPNATPSRTPECFQNSPLIESKNLPVGVTTVAATVRHDEISVFSDQKRQKKVSVKNRRKNGGEENKTGGHSIASKKIGRE